MQLYPPPHSNSGSADNLRLSLGDTISIGARVADYVRFHGEAPAREHRARAFKQLDAMARYRRDTKRWKADAIIAPYAHVDVPNRFAYCETQRQIGRTANMMAKQKGHVLP